MIKISITNNSFILIISYGFPNETIFYEIIMRFKKSIDKYLK